MTFRKIQCLWMKLKALTMTYHLNGIYKCAPLSMTDIKEKVLRSGDRIYNSVKERNESAQEQKASMKQELGLMYGNHA